MSHPEEFGSIFHRGSDKHLRKWYVWAEVDPETLDVLFVYYANSGVIGHSSKGLRPRECTSSLQKAVLQHVRESIIASQEIIQNDEDNLLVIDDDDPKIVRIRPH